MERVTFNDVRETIGTYVNEASNPRNDGWTHNHYRKWLKEIKELINEAASLPLHQKE
jgi:hypothetical protein